MAIHRGIQSVIFFYLSCAPCSDARYRKKRKQEAIRDRAERQAYEDEMPNAYRHPSPSSTNPHWNADIALGPNLPYRGRKKTQHNGSQRGRGSAKSATQVSDNSNIPSSVDLRRSDSSDERHDSKWNVRLYQREDEHLWGSESPEPPLRTHLYGSSIVDGLTKPARARTRDSTTPSTYDSYRNPALNDYHPATVTRVETRDDVAWMMQPPPVAEVMSGKERAPRSRSDSGGSRPSVNGSTKLSRQVSARIMEKKIRNGESGLPAGMMFEPSSRSRGSTTTSMPRSSHDSRKFDEQDFARSPSKRSKQKPAHLQLPESSDSDVTVVHQPSPGNDTTRLQVRGKTSRPALSTIMSQGSDIPKYEDFHTPKENTFPATLDGDESYDRRDRLSRRSELLMSDGSRKPTLLNSHVISHSPSSNTILQAPFDEDEPRRSLGDPELLESWQTPGFQLDEWVHEHTKREVRQRWSMDL